MAMAKRPRVVSIGLFLDRKITNNEFVNKIPVQNVSISFDYLNHGCFYTITKLDDSSITTNQPISRKTMKPLYILKLLILISQFFVDEFLGSIHNIVFQPSSWRKKNLLVFNLKMKKIILQPLNFLILPFKIDIFYRRLTILMLDSIPGVFFGGQQEVIQISIFYNQQSQQRQLQLRNPTRGTKYFEDFSNTHF